MDPYHKHVKALYMYFLSHITCSSSMLLATNFSKMPEYMHHHGNVGNRSPETRAPSMKQLRQRIRVKNLAFLNTCSHRGCHRPIPQKYSWGGGGEGRGGESLVEKRYTCIEDREGIRETGDINNNNLTMQFVQIHACVATQGRD